MKEGENIILTDGKGVVAEGEIHVAERHKCNVSVKDVANTVRTGKVLHLCVAFTKNNSRNEWLLEKATELGVGSIIPVSTTRSEKVHIRYDRWEKILQSAILQSKQNFLPNLSNIMPLPNVLKQYGDVPQKLVAHCIDEAAKDPLHKMLKQDQDAVVLIGPEGDFTADEVNLCIGHGFKPVSLGVQRLRTETAAVAAAAYFNVICDAGN
jgi:16S rRNA (uracil1498-N3)-methyltransferase